MSAPTAGQIAGIEALKNSEEAVQAMVAEYNQRRKYMVSAFNEMGLSCFEPKGAFYTFPSIKSVGLDEEEFCEKLLVEEHVAVVPGSAFGASGQGHIRVCYATAMLQIEQAMERIDRFVSKYRG
jgi:aminotransferase